MKLRIIFGTLVLLLLLNNMTAQTVPQGINYQGIAKSTSNVLIANKTIGLRIGIYAGSATGTLVWEERHTNTTNAFGLFHVIIGQGASTGNGTAASFSAINWGSAAHFLKVEVDVNGGTSYVVAEQSQLLSVPYSLYSLKAGDVSKNISLNDLSDVDTTGVKVGQTIKWNGSLWLPAKDNNSDTALFAYNSNTAHLADTAQFAQKAKLVDSALYAKASGFSTHATLADSAVNALHSIKSDTATYALNCINTTNDWHLNGNTGITATNFIGTINAADLIFKTNNAERMRITSAGKVGLGTTNPTATLHILGNDGFVEEGTFGSGTTLASGAGTRMMWYPKYAAFRAGYVSGTQWNDAQMGAYSFAVGNSTIALGVGAVATGVGSSARDSCSIAMGYGCSAGGKFAVALGNNAAAAGMYGVAIGRGPTANGVGAQAIGYHVVASGKYATAFGFYTTADADNATAMGYYSSTNGMKGSFVYADQTGTGSTAVTSNTAPNQFLVKASGGTIFYTNPSSTVGVTLAAGSGSWSSLSDKNKKEHFGKVNGEEILSKIAAMEINSWNYKAQAPSIRHIGPFAQDFYNAFHLGEGETTISMVDIEGINLLALQTLITRTRLLKEKMAEIEKLNASLVELTEEKQKLESRLRKIESQLERSGILQTTK